LEFLLSFHEKALHGGKVLQIKRSVDEDDFGNAFKIEAADLPRRLELALQPLPRYHNPNQFPRWSWCR
jgi:hypothetical protein